MSITKEEFEKRLNAIPEVEPDDFDKELLEECKNNPECNEYGCDLDELKSRVKHANGRISLRVPKELHAELIESAKDNGVSLNQYIVYKLAKE